MSKTIEKTIRKTLIYFFGIISAILFIVILIGIIGYAIPKQNYYIYDQSSKIIDASTMSNQISLFGLFLVLFTIILTALGFVGFQNIKEAAQESAEKTAENLFTAFKKEKETEDSQKKKLENLLERRQELQRRLHNLQRERENLGALAEKTNMDKPNKP
ncbi:MAG: hypothetical protein QM529_01075 [Hydrotalea sp.]|nr:hypothetical protein [Hydrotalea sp.]